MQIGHSNHFQVGCEVKAKSVGDCNTFEMKSLFPKLYITILLKYSSSLLLGLTGENCVITSGCTIGMGVKIGGNITVEENTSIFGANANLQITPNAKQVCKQ